VELSSSLIAPSREAGEQHIDPRRTRIAQAAMERIIRATMAVRNLSIQFLEQERPCIRPAPTDRPLITWEVFSIHQKDPLKRKIWGLTWSEIQARYLAMTMSGRLLRDADLHGWEEARLKPMVIW
jgi:hypothetical protein